MGVCMPPSFKAVRFGVFELDERAGELRREGLKIRLSDQPLQILLLLLEHPGEIVTREELRQRLWSSDTFVDFEQSLNAAVKRLREALGDSGAHPRLIETLPRHGYRLIAPVEMLGKPTSELSSRKSAHWSHHEGWWLAATLVALILGAAVTFLYAHWAWQSRFGHKPAQIRSLAVIPIANLGDDSTGEYFCDGLTEALITELGQISSLRVISRQSVMQYRDTTKTIPQIARELGVDAILEGAALRSLGKVRISAQLIRAQPEDHVWAKSYERNDVDVIPLQREIARAIADEIRPVLNVR